MVDVDDNTADAMAPGIRERGGQASFVACDVTHAPRLEATFSCIIDQAGRMDTLVNCVDASGSRSRSRRRSKLKSIFLSSNAGVHSLTRVLAFELSQHGVDPPTQPTPNTTATDRVVAVRGQAQRDAIGKSTAAPG